jgi:hypothetical protein
MRHRRCYLLRRANQRDEERAMKPLTLYRRVVVQADLETIDEGTRATAAVLHARAGRSG